MAGTAGEVGVVAVAEFVARAVEGIVPPADRSVAWAVEEPHAVTMQTATTTTDLRSTIQSTGQTHLSREPRQPTNERDTVSLGIIGDRAADCADLDTRQSLMIWRHPG